MAVKSGSVNLSTSSATAVYSTPDGVETCLIVQVTSEDNAWFGDSSVAANAGIVLSEGSAPLVLAGFTGTLYGIAQAGSPTAFYIAADIE
jgi:hypothetical protein